MRNSGTLRAAEVEANMERAKQKVESELQAQKTKEVMEELLPESECWVDGPTFTLAIAAIVLANAVFLGVEASMPGREVGDSITAAVIRNMFCTIWMLEMLLKIFFKRLGYFYNAWNWFDFVLAW